MPAPRAGDCVVHCAHLSEVSEKRGDVVHWWSVRIDFERPDGSKGEAQWFISCQDCYRAGNGSSRTLEPAGDDFILDHTPRLRSLH